MGPQGWVLACYIPLESSGNEEIVKLIFEAIKRAKIRWPKKKKKKNKQKSCHEIN